MFKAVRSSILLIFAVISLSLGQILSAKVDSNAKKLEALTNPLQRAIEDLSIGFGEDYPDGEHYLNQLKELRRRGEKRRMLLS